MRQFPAARCGFVCLAGMVLWSVLPISAQAQSVEPAAEPENGSAAGSADQDARTITLGNVGTWSIAEGVEVSRRMVQGPDGEVTVITLERLTEHGEVAPGSFVTLSLYPEGITLQSRLCSSQSTRSRHPRLPMARHLPRSRARLAVKRVSVRSLRSPRSAACCRSMHAPWL